MGRRRGRLLIGLCSALVLFAFPGVTGANPQAQGTPAWQREIVDYQAQLNPYGQWLAARRVLLTNLDCTDNHGRALTLQPGQVVFVEASVPGSNGQPVSPLFLGLVGWKCYVTTALANSMDKPVPVIASTPRQPTPAPPLPPPMATPTPTPPAEQGVILTVASGEQTYLEPDTFVKIGDAPAIYRVNGGQLHAFSTWPEFLNAGGEPDLSNVTIFSDFRDPGGLFGLPVQP